MSARTDIPTASGGGRFFGHLQALRHQPVALLERVRAECGEVGEFRMLDRPVVLLTGPRAQEAFFRAKDDQLDPQPTSNQMMKPIFGDGVVYDLPAEQRRDMMRTPALRDENLRKSAGVIARETERMAETLGEAGEIDLLDFTTELTIYTSSACLIGRSFREEITPEFARAYHDLEKGTDALGFLNGRLSLAAFRARDRARARLVELITEIIAARQAAGGSHRDLLQILLSLADEQGNPRFSADQMTGILVSTMFAGHHTSAATSAWALIEMLRHPEHLARVTAELDQIYAGDTDVSFQALREIPALENVVKETLRLHPPIIFLLRTACQDFHYDRWTIARGKLVAVAPVVSHHDPACFRDPERFDPDRYGPGREEDRAQPWAWIPFGGGPHRCLGASFALVQLKAIFSILLRRYVFELAAPPETYRDDHSRMVVLPRQPCRVRYRRRAEDGWRATAAPDGAPGRPTP